jgi:mono/diheme cytochrome c family protein
MSSTHEQPVEEAEPHVDLRPRDAGARGAEANEGVEPAVPEPSKGPIPIWIVWVIGVGIFWAGAYLFSYSGGFRADVFDFQPKFGAAGGAQAPPDPKVVGKALFSANCITCHQADGQGVPGQYPPLAGSDVVLGDAANHMVAIVLKGLQGPVTVLGKPFNNSMQAWEGQYTDQQVAAILTYERSDWGNNAPPITADLVKEVRAEFKDRKEQWTWPEIQKIPAKNSAGAAGAAPGGKPAPASGGQSPAPAAQPATQSQPPTPVASPVNAS